MAEDIILNATAPVIKIVEAVKLSDNLSVTEQEQIIQWSENTYGSVWRQVSDLTGLNPPPELFDVWEFFMMALRAAQMIV